MTLQQAYGRTVSRGSGAFDAWMASDGFMCDGTTVNYITIPVLPDAGSGAFHGGPAVITVSATYNTRESCGYSCYTFYSESGQFGPTGTRLGGK